MVGARTSISTPALFSRFPPYIRPPREDIKRDDLEFLSRRGALIMPSVELRDQLLRCFILYVEPYMPILDLEAFFNAIDGKGNSPPINLTLFQAIMFSGTAFVDMQLLQEAGYDSRRAARNDYYQKVKVRRLSQQPSVWH